MVCRSTPQRTIDDRAFPIRLKIVVPRGGLGNVLNEMIVWLQDNLPRGDFAQRSGGWVGTVDSAAFYFRSLDDAQRFRARFPALQLADGTVGSYDSPAMPWGRKD